MATPAQLLSDVAAAVEAQVSGIVRLGSDYRDDLEAIPAGATRYQLRGGPAAQDFDSNATRIVEAIELLVSHHLADPDDERAYTEAAMQTNVAALIALSFWKGLASAFEVLSRPEYAVEREINVVTVTITTQVSIVP